MKNLWVCLLLLISISACSGHTSTDYGCDIDGTLCIKMLMEEPVLYGKSNPISIRVSSNLDIYNLRIFLYGSTQIMFEEMGSWKTGVNWTVDLKANQPQTITKNILLPQMDGFFGIISSANTNQLRAVYSLSISQHAGNVIIYYPNTPIPYTQSPLPTIAPELLETLYAIPSSTAYPTLISRPTHTSTPTPWVYPPPATPPLEAPGEEPYP